LRILKSHQEKYSTENFAKEKDENLDEWEANVHAHSCEGTRKYENSRETENHTKSRPKNAYCPFGLTQRTREKMRSFENRRNLVVDARR